VVIPVTLRLAISVWANVAIPVTFRSSSSVCPSTSMSPFKSILVAVTTPTLYPSVPVPTTPLAFLLTNSFHPACAKYALPVL